MINAPTPSTARINDPSTPAPAVATALSHDDARSFHDVLGEEKSSRERVKNQANPGPPATSKAEERKKPALHDAVTHDAQNDAQVSQASQISQVSPVVLGAPLTAVPVGDSLPASGAVIAPRVPLSTHGTLDYSDQPLSPRGDATALVTPFLDAPAGRADDAGGAPVASDVSGAHQTQDASGSHVDVGKRVATSSLGAALVSAPQTSATTGGPDRVGRGESLITVRASSGDSSEPSPATQLRGAGSAPDPTATSTVAGKIVRASGSNTPRPTQVSPGLGAMIRAAGGPVVAGVAVSSGGDPAKQVRGVPPGVVSQVMPEVRAASSGVRPAIDAASSPFGPPPSPSPLVGGAVSVSASGAASAPSNDARGASPAPSIDLTRLVSDVSRTVTSEGDYRMTLSLHPESMGTLHATVSLSGNNLDVSITPDSRQGHQALSPDIETLRTELARGGMNVNVTLHDHGSSHPQPESHEKVSEYARAFPPEEVLAHETTMHGDEQIHVIL